MDREERLRRRRERDRARRLRETAEEREVRLARRREYERTRRSAIPDEVDALTSDTSIVTESLNECTWTLTIPVKAHPSNQF